MGGAGVGSVGEGRRGRVRQWEGQGEGSKEQDTVGGSRVGCSKTECSGADWYLQTDFPR